MFPSDRPDHGTGAGAIVWSDVARAAPAAKARASPRSAPTTNRASRSRRAPPPGRRSRRAGALARERRPARADRDRRLRARRARTAGPLIQGAAGRPVRRARSHRRARRADRARERPTSAMSRSRPQPRPPGGAEGGTRSARVHVERFYAHALRAQASRCASARRRAGPSALTLAMDYRSEVLAVWQQGAAIYARLVPNQGAPRPIQRLAPVGSQLQIAARAQRRRARDRRVERAARATRRPSTSTAPRGRALQRPAAAGALRRPRRAAALPPPPPASCASAPRA